MLKRLTLAWRLALVATAITAAFLALVYAGLLRLEVPNQHWFAHALYPWSALLLVPIVALGLLLAALAGALRAPRTRAHWVIGAAFICACACAIGTRAGTPSGIVTIASTIICDGSNSYFNTAVDTTDPLALARDYPAQMPHLRLHAATQSPGAMLLHAALRRCYLGSPTMQGFVEALLWLSAGTRTTEVAAALNLLWQLRLSAADVGAATMIGLLFPLLGALGVFPVFALARHLGGRRTALIVTALYAVTPSLSWFTASLDQVYPTLAVLVLLLLYHAARWRRGSYVAATGAGILTGLGIFLNFGFVVVGAIGALVLGLLACRGLGHGKAGPAGTRPAARLGGLALYAAGALAVLATVQFGLGIDLVGVARVSGDLRTKLYLHDLPRPWLTWVLLNPLEFMIGMGWSSAAVIVAALAWWRRVRGPGILILSATLAVLLLLDLSGAARAEWSRLLLSAMPLCLLGAAGAVRTLRLTQPGPALLLVLAQGLYVLIGYQLLDVWGYWTIPFRS